MTRRQNLWKTSSWEQVRQEVAFVPLSSPGGTDLPTESGSPFPPGLHLRASFPEVSRCLRKPGDWLSVFLYSEPQKSEEALATKLRFLVVTNPSLQLGVRVTYHLTKNTL